MLGMGGSQLYIPILFWLGMDFKLEAIPLGMLLNVVNSISASFTYARRRLADYKIAFPFGISMVIFAPLGTWTNVNLPTKCVILVFSLFTAVAAILMLSGWRPKKSLVSRRSKFILGIIAGSILGFFAGLIGRGGGSFVVPLLYIAGLEPKVAAATSAIVISFSGLSSFLSHILISAKPNWILWFLCVISVFTGSQMGSRFMVYKLKHKSVRVIFGLVLIFISILLVMKAIIM